MIILVVASHLTMTDISYDYIHSNMLLRQHISITNLHRYSISLMASYYKMMLICHIINGSCDHLWCHIPLHKSLNIQLTLKQLHKILSNNFHYSTTPVVAPPTIKLANEMWSMTSSLSTVDQNTSSITLSLICLVGCYGNSY